MSVLTNKISQLAGKFGSISNYQSQALSGFLNENFSKNLSVIDYQSNMSYSLQPTDHGCIITTYCDTSLPNSENVNGESYDIDFNNEDWGSTVIMTLDGSQSLREYIQNLNTSNNLYDLLAALTAKFESTPTMSLSDYKNLCDQYISDDITVKEFERTSLLSFGTSVNRASFLNLVSSFFRQALNIQSSDIKVPDTRVYSMNSLLNLVDLGTIWSIISTAVILISKVAGAIVMIVGMIISAFASLLSKAKSLINPSIDTDEDNGVWNAPLFTVTDCDLSSNTGWYCKPDIISDSVIAYKLCGLSVYVFGDSWQHANVVCYIDNIVDPKKFGEYIRDKIHLYQATHWVGEHQTIIYDPIFCDIGSNIINNLSESHYYDAFDWYAEKDKYPISSLLATLAFSFLSLMTFAHLEDGYVALSGMKWLQAPTFPEWNHAINFSPADNDPIISIGYAALSMFITAIAKQDHDDNYAEDLNWDGIESLVSASYRTDYIFDVWDSCNRYSGSNNLAISSGLSLQNLAVYYGPTDIDASTFPDVDITLPVTNQVKWTPSILTLDAHTSIIQQIIYDQDVYFDDDMNVSTNLYTVSYQDCYPVRYEFTTPKASESALTKALITLAGVAVIFIASMVAYKVTKIKITNQFREKSAHTLSNAKARYENGDISLKEYRKITRNYNWKARLLGLPTYDYMNSWYNVDSTSITDSASNITASLGTASDSDDVDLSVNQKPISSMIFDTTSAVAQNDALLQQLIKLIRGE